MGYRTYIGSISKKRYNDIKNLSHNDVLDYFKFYDDDYDIEEYNDKYISVRRFGKMLFEFGKYTDFKPPLGSYNNFFKNQETQSYFGDNDLRILNKFFLQYIIDNQSDNIKNRYKEMNEAFFVGRFNESTDFLNTIDRDLNGDVKFDYSKITQYQQNTLYNMIEHIRSMTSEWDYLTPYNLDGGDEVTTSDKYEYNIFELVRIYKSFDWENNYMYFYGY